jgi:hypothetical protein
MTNEQDFELPKKELDIPDSLYLGPEMLMDLERTSRGEPLTWGATPLEPHRKDIAIQQSNVQSEISEYFPKSGKDVPFKLKWDTARYIEDNYVMRTAHRVNRNYESYQSRGKFDISEVPIEALSFVDRSLTGHASPAEIIATADIQQIPTAELASLSHPYGKRMEHLEPARAAVREGILFFGGELCETNHQYEVKSSNYFTDEYKAIEPSLLMTRMTQMGKIGEDIAVFERSSFVVILSRLVPEFSEQIQAIEYNKSWSSDILHIPGFSEAVERALEANNYESVVPISTTVFETNNRLVKELLENDEHIARRQKQMAQKALADARDSRLLGPSTWEQV